MNVQVLILLVYTHFFTYQLSIAQNIRIQFEVLGKLQNGCVRHHLSLNSDTSGWQLWIAGLVTGENLPYFC